MMIGDCGFEGVLLLLFLSHRPFEIRIFSLRVHTPPPGHKIRMCEDIFSEMVVGGWGVNTYCRNGSGSDARLYRESSCLTLMD